MKTTKEQIIADITSKVEAKLASHKVELTLIDDLKKVNDNIISNLKTADNSWKSYQDYLTNASKPFVKMMASRKSLVDSTSQIDLLLKNAEVKAKDLGMNVQEIPMYSVIKSNLNKTKEILGTIDSFKDPSSFQ